MNMQSRPETSDPAELEQQLAAALAERDEALERQTAAAEILKVISQSPTDVQSGVRSHLQTAGAAVSLRHSAACCSMKDNRFRSSRPVA